MLSRFFYNKTVVLFTFYTQKYVCFIDQSFIINTNAFVEMISLKIIQKYLQLVPLKLKSMQMFVLGMMTYGPIVLLALITICSLTIFG